MLTKTKTHNHEATALFNGGRIWRLCHTCNNTKASCISCILFSSLASVILYAVACWGSRLKVAAANRLNRLICKASNVVTNIISLGINKGF